jgi:S-DNA-T family DNA segregation ATPase FtsK/SpoIIIE
MTSKTNPKKTVTGKQKTTITAKQATDQRYSLIENDRSKSDINDFKQFGWDLLGTFLVLLAVLTLLGLLGLSRGTLIKSWILFLKRSFGFGSYLLVLVFGCLGFLVFRYSAGKSFPISFGRLMAIEGLLLVTFPLLSFTGGVSLDRAYDGLDGGTLGWGLAQLLIPLLNKTGALILYMILFFAFTGIATGFFKIAFAKIRVWRMRPTLVKVKPVLPAKSQPVVGIESKTERAAKIEKREKLVKGEERNVSVSQNQWRDDRLPSLDLLLDENILPPDEGSIKQKAFIIEQKLAEFGVPVKVIGFRVGPTVTQYAVEPGYTERTGPDGKMMRQKVKVSKISSLSRDLALALSAERLRIETPVPGKSFVGIEVPNEDNAFVRLKSILESEEFQKNKAPLTLSLGRDVSGEPVKTDLEKLPHLLIAGTTNSGKSVCVTALTTCLVMNNTPSDLRLVMLDPKMVELVRFNGLPHLLGKVETELERMLAVLRWAQMEMDLRYRLLAEVKARNLTSYNQKMMLKKKPTLPRIVIVIDELADLMMSAPDQTEHSLIRLAQMARATGIHMIVATQRPSTDVVTGLIKANFPARISFAMASSIDSRVILDANGAENLLGRGDMLFLDPARSGLRRVQGVIVSDNEIEKILKHWQSMVHTAEIPVAPWEELVDETGSLDNDELLEQAISVVRTARKASTSLLQRRLRIGFPRAARLIEELEEMGVIGPAVGSGKERDVLLDPEDEDLSEKEEY